MGLDIERFDKLKRQFPELEEGVVKEALILYDNDFDRARKALQVGFKVVLIFTYNHYSGL
jgi:hypothetical protein